MLHEKEHFSSICSFHNHLVIITMETKLVFPCNLHCLPYGRSTSEQCVNCLVLGIHSTIWCCSIFENWFFFIFLFIVSYALEPKIGYQIRSLLQNHLGLLITMSWYLEVVFIEAEHLALRVVYWNFAPSIADGAAGVILVPLVLTSS